jgi:hypothetical protein
LPQAETKGKNFEIRQEAKKLKKARTRRFEGNARGLAPLAERHMTILIKPRPTRTFEPEIKKLAAKPARAKPRQRARTAQEGFSYWNEVATAQQESMQQAEPAGPAEAPRRIEARSEGKIDEGALVPGLVLSPDMLISEDEIGRQKLAQEFEHEQITMRRLEEYNSPAGMTARSGRKRKALNALEAFFKSLALFVQRLIAMLSPRKRRMLTARGWDALAKLEMLYALLSAGPEDNMDYVALRVAFGQAYFAMMQTSEQHYRAHRGRGQEDYSAQFDGFLRQLP